MIFLRPQGYISSPFAGSEAFRANPHAGTDFMYGFKKPVFAVYDGLIYKVLGKGEADVMKYKNIYELCDTPLGWFEISYVHAWDILVSEGDKVLLGQPIMTEGNTGTEVFRNGIRVPATDKPSGSGSHLHIQCRPVERVKKITSGRHYLNKANGAKYKDAEGYYYQIKFDNTTKGCVDIVPYLFTPTKAFLRTQYTKALGYVKSLLSK